MGHSVQALDYVHSCGRNINDRWNLHANTSKTQLVTTEMVFHGISIISAPHNMGVDILFVQLSSLLTEIWSTNEFSVMATLICIQNVRGTIFQLVNIANRFLHIFSNLETLIRFIFPGGAGYPYLPTQLIGFFVLFALSACSVTSSCSMHGHNLVQCMAIKLHNAWS